MLLFVIIYLAFVLFTIGFVGAYNNVSTGMEFTIAIVLGIFWPITLTISLGGFFAAICKRVDQ